MPQWRAQDERMEVCDRNGAPLRGATWISCKSVDGGALHDTLIETDEACEHCGGGTAAMARPKVNIASVTPSTHTAV